GGLAQLTHFRGDRGAGFGDLREHLFTGGGVQFADGRSGFGAINADGKRGGFAGVDVGAGRGRGDIGVGGRFSPAGIAFELGGVHGRGRFRANAGIGGGGPGHGVAIVGGTLGETVGLGVGRDRGGSGTLLGGM